MKEQRLIKENDVSPRRDNFLAAYHAGFGKNRHAQTTFKLFKLKQKILIYQNG